MSFIRGWMFAAQPQSERQILWYSPTAGDFFSSNANGKAANCRRRKDRSRRRRRVWGMKCTLSHLSKSFFRAPVNFFLMDFSEFSADEIAVIKRWMARAGALGGSACGPRKRRTAAHYRRLSALGVKAREKRRAAATNSSAKEN